MTRPQAYSALLSVFPKQLFRKSINILSKEMRTLSRICRKTLSNSRKFLKMPSLPCHEETMRHCPAASVWSRQLSSRQDVTERTSSRGLEEGLLEEGCWSGRSGGTGQRELKESECWIMTVSFVREQVEPRLQSG